MRVTTRANFLRNQTRRSGYKRRSSPRFVSFGKESVFMDVVRLLARLLGVATISSVVASTAFAQSSSQPLFDLRDASGTSWLPDARPVLGVRLSIGVWDVMLHANIFAQFLYEPGETHRTSHQAGSINWLMAM